MERQKYCVYNRTRECFLSLNISAAHTTFARLRGLIGKVKLTPDEGMWVVPSSGIHTLGVLFSLDLIYLDENYRIIHTIESFPRFRIAPLKVQAASVLEMRVHTIYSSQTQVGDQLLICEAEEIENRFGDIERPQLARFSPPLVGMAHRKARGKTESVEGTR